MGSLAHANLSVAAPCRCVDKPGGKPINEANDSYTARCLSNCVERFLDTTDFMLKRLQSKAR